MNRFTSDEIIMIYLVIINLILFFMMGYDKRRAIHKKYRIREATLFLFGLAGGSLGGLFGMLVFRHKTKKRVFYIVFICELLIQVILLTQIMGYTNYFILY